MDNNIRWIQRLNNFQKAFNQLEEAVEEAYKRELSNLEKEGVIQRFEYNQELSWKVIKDFYQSIGEIGIQGSRDAFRLATERGLIPSNCGSVLMNSIKSRNLVVHTYDETTANEIFKDIINEYYNAFKTLKIALEKEKENRGL